MIRIAHRGNTTGPNPSYENNPEYITKALDAGFHAEVDVRLISDAFYLGHDSPTHMVDLAFFRDDRIWTHCKNVEAFMALACIPDVNCFYQENDNIALTSKGFLWTHLKCPTYCQKSVVVRLDNRFVPETNIKPYGICSDFAYNYWVDEVRRPPFEVLVCDIDGVLTSGKNYDLDGKVIGKSYCDLDFTAIKRFKAAGIQVCFLSGDRKVNEAMAATRKIDFFYNPPGIDKVKFLPEIIKKYGTEVAYIGDDYYDIAIMGSVKVSFCPKDSPLAVRRVATYVVPIDAGRGVLAGIYDIFEDQIPKIFPRDSADVNP